MEPIHESPRTARKADKGEITVMPVNEAVRILRKLTGETQQVFSTRLGLSLRAYQKYEQNQMPEPRALMRLLAVAIDGKVSRDLQWSLGVPLLDQLKLPGWTVEVILQGPLSLGKARRMNFKHGGGAPDPREIRFKGGQ
jgi:transcriptional regulator with XRE-family HTH domain